MLAFLLLHHLGAKGLQISGGQHLAAYAVLSRRVVILLSLDQIK